MTPEQLSQIQQGLITLGFFKGAADGEFGPLTRAAIGKYQEAKGLPESNFLPKEQRQALLKGRTVGSVGSSNPGGNSAASAPSQASLPKATSKGCGGFGQRIVETVEDEATRLLAGRGSMPSQLKTRYGSAVVFAKACQLGLGGIVSKTNGEFLQERQEPQLAEDDQPGFRQDVRRRPARPGGQSFLARFAWRARPRLSFV